MKCEICKCSGYCSKKNTNKSTKPIGKRASKSGWDTKTPRCYSLNKDN